MTEHLGRHSLEDLALGARRIRQREVGMGLDVDEARRDDESVRVDRAMRSALIAACDAHDPAVADGQIGATAAAPVPSRIAPLRMTRSSMLVASE